MWDEIRMECSAFRVNSEKSSRISSRTMGSRPLVASSKTSSRGLWLSATAMASFMVMPLE